MSRRVNKTPITFGTMGGAVGGANERIAAFWDWFSANQKSIFFFDDDAKSLMDFGGAPSVFSEVSTRLARLNPSLGFEFGPIFDGKREFVVSAGGDKALFPFVRQIASAAPDAVRERFTITALRPRRPSQVAYMGFETGTFCFDDLRFRLRSVGAARYDLDVFVPADYAAISKDWDLRVMAVLDLLIGESDTETHIRYIAAEPLVVAGSGAVEHHGLHAFAQLPQVLDRLLGRPPLPTVRFPWESDGDFATSLSDKEVGDLLCAERDKARLLFA